MHIFREANRAVDLIISNSYLIPIGLTMYCEPPSDLHAILVEDDRGVAMPHMINFHFVGC